MAVACGGEGGFVSQKLFIKSLSKSQFSHKSVNLSLVYTSIMYKERDDEFVGELTSGKQLYKHFL